MQSYQTQPVKRNLFIDLTKAIAIILVVLGHSIQYCSGTNYLNEHLFFDNILFKAIYSFHMPLFMLISGYLFASGINKGAKEIIINKLRSLIIPIFTWAIIPLILYIIYNFQNEELHIISTLKYYIQYSIFSLWFLWAIFYCTLIVIINNKIFKDSIIIYILIFIISFVTPDSYNICLYKYMYPFFILGYFYKKNNLQKRFCNIYKNNYFLFITGGLFLILLCYFDRDKYIYISAHTIIGKDIIRQLYNDLFRYLIGLIGSIFTLTILYRIYLTTIKHNKLQVRNFIWTIGKNTMGIYIISSYLNSYFWINNTKYITGPNCLIITIATITMVSISILIIKCIQKSNLLNKFLLGARI